MKFNVISGQTFGMASQSGRIQSIISVAGHQVIRDLSEPSAFTIASGCNGKRNKPAVGPESK